MPMPMPRPMPFPGYSIERQGAVRQSRQRLVDRHFYVDVVRVVIVIVIVVVFSLQSWQFWCCACQTN